MHDGKHVVRVSACDVAGLRAGRAVDDGQLWLRSNERYIHDDSTMAITSLEAHISWCLVSVSLSMRMHTHTSSIVSPYRCDDSVSGNNSQSQAAINEIYYSHRTSSCHQRSIHKAFLQSVLRLFFLQQNAD